MARAPLVLIVSEYEWASRSIDSVIGPRGYAIQRAYTGKQALERAAESDPEAVFIDFDLPDMRTSDLCRALVETDAVSRAAPILILASGHVSRDAKLEALEAGAWDVLGLPLDAEELLLRMDRYIRGKLEADRLREDALVDAVTGLYSWHGISRRVSEIGAAAERHGRPLACVVVAVGSEETEGGPIDEGALATRVAGALREAIRKSDILARIGPREFAVVAPDTSPVGAQVLAERLRQHSGGLEGGYRFRAGVSAVDDLRRAGMDPMDLVLRATRALREEPSTN